MTASPQTELERELIAYLMRGADLLKAEQLEEARTVIRLALNIAPGEPRARNLLGLVLFRLGQLQESLDVYRELCADYPGDCGFLLNLGLVELRVGDVDAAVEDLERVTGVEPGNQRALGYLGLAYAQRGEVTRACDAFARAGQPELVKEIEARVQAAQDAAPASGAPATHEEFVEERTAVAPEDVLEMAVKASSVPDEEDVDAAFDEMEHGFGVPEPQKRRITDVGPGPPLSPTVVGGEALPRASAAPPAATTTAPAAAPGALGDASRPSDAAAGFDLRTLARVCRVIMLEDPGAPHEAESKPAPVAREGEALPVAAFVTEGLLHQANAGQGLRVGQSGALLLRIDGSIVLRLEGGAAISGALEFEPARRRVRGRVTDDTLGGDQPFYFARGAGSVVSLPASGETFVALRLDDDIVYVREDAVLAFDAELHWESGRIPGVSSCPMLQFRGRGTIAVRMCGRITPVKLERNQAIGVDAEKLFGWVGRIVPHAVALGGTSGRHIGCTGEGVLLLTGARLRER
jgi:uncharacterized protein (AIM24 family)